MGNQNAKPTDRDDHNDHNDNIFHDLETVVKATDFVLKGSCSSAMDASAPAKSRRLHKRKRVHFNERVRVRKIEHHSSYTEEERRAIWRSTEEIRLHAKRNSMEMKWEGRDWRMAAEETDMFFDVTTQLRYHPCWITPRMPYHSGTILFGTHMRLASYNVILMCFVHKYGINVFAED